VGERQESRSRYGIREDINADPGRRRGRGFGKGLNGNNWQTQSTRRTEIA
jgi:hypothetical protein